MTIVNLFRGVWIIKKETDKRTRGQGIITINVKQDKEKNDKFKFGQSGTQFIYG